MSLFLITVYVIFYISGCIRIFFIACFIGNDIVYLIIELLPDNSTAKCTLGLSFVIRSTTVNINNKPMDILIHKPSRLVLLTSTAHFTHNIT